MTSVHTHDLAFYANGGVYRPDSLQFVSSTLDVSQAWLTQLVCGRVKPETAVTLVTFSNRDQLHEKGLKRYNIEPTVQRSQFQTINLSDKLVSNKGKFENVALSTLLDGIKSSLANQDNSVVVLECPEVLLSLGHSGLEVVNFVYQLEQAAKSIYVLSNSDVELVNDESPIAEQMHVFINQMVHRASLFISLRPFETGRADDVTGVLRVCAGPKVVEGATTAVAEGEYLYLVSHDSVKLYYR